MDLNIGTAFWFAARGRGHLVDANSDAISQLYEIKDNDRPLLRLGGEGARDGVGLSEEKERIVSLRREKLHSSDLNSKIGKPSADKCSKEKCNRVVKIGCINGYCKRCCDKIGNLSDAGDACLVHNKRDARNQSRKYEENIEITQTSDNVDYKLLEMLSSRTAEYSCQCKALLVGIGADEQMAGYGRHRTVFMKSSWEGLQEELNMDMARLWKRNLGRSFSCDCAAELIN